MKLNKNEEQMLKEARGILDLTSIEAWIEYIEPFMVRMVDFPDPSKFKNKEDLLLPYVEAYGRASAVTSLRDYIAKQKDVFDNLSKKLESEEENEFSEYSI